MLALGRELLARQFQCLVGRLLIKLLLVLLLGGAAPGVVSKCLTNLAHYCTRLTIDYALVIHVGNPVDRSQYVVLATVK